MKKFSDELLGAVILASAVLIPMELYFRGWL